MKVQAAVLWGLNEKWSVEDVELDGPSEGEILVKLASSGLCHSDEHLVTGDIPIPFPVVGGHEGAGVVEEIGPNVSHVAVGDHVVLSFLPACGRCKWCASGHTNLCDLGANIILGPQLDGTYRFHARGEDVGQMCLLGTFCPYTVVPAASVVKIDDDIPLRVASLVGCGVTTGFGTATNSAGVRPGDTVVVMGIGGVGANAVQGARCVGRPEHRRPRPGALQAREGGGARRHPHRRRLRRGLGDRQRAHPWPARRELHDHHRRRRGRLRPPGAEHGG